MLKYNNEEFYDLDIGGLKRRLPVVKIGGALCIASFVLLGDVALIERSAELLVERMDRGFDIIAVPEAKAIPLAHAVARIIGGRERRVDYAVIRKSKKAYSTGGLEAEVKSITTVATQRLYLDAVDVERLRGRKVCLIDDVISTGGTVAAVAGLVNKAGGKVHQLATVLLEGDRDPVDFAGYAAMPLVHLGRIPLYVREGGA